MVSVVPALRKLAGHTFRRFPVPVVAITGSVGKTTTKDLIADVLETRYRVLRSAENFNIEGIPSALLDIPFTKSLRVALTRLPVILQRTLHPPRPDYFVLEVGTTKPGDIALSVSMFVPTIAVITTFMPAHLEQLGSVEGVAREKSNLVRALPPGGHAVLRYDDKRVLALRGLHRGPDVTYGFDPRADVHADPPERTRAGLATVIHDPDSDVPLVFPHLVNTHHLYAVMAAWCVGRIANVPAPTMAAAVQRMQPLDGRGGVRTTASGLLVMDESWNANPASLSAALETFKVVSQGRRRVVILGDMLELGAESRRYHEALGRQAAASADVLVTVGLEARYFVAGFIASKAGARHFSFDNVDDAAAYVEDYVRPHDALLVKGSHGVHLERLVHVLAAPPVEADVMNTRASPDFEDTRA